MLLTRVKPCHFTGDIVRCDFVLQELRLETFMQQDIGQTEILYVYQQFPYGIGNR